MTCLFCDPDRPALGDYNIEKSVISGMMQSPDTQVDAALRLLKPADFSHNHAGLLFDLIARRYSEKEPVDPVSIVSYLFDKGMQNEITPLFVSEAFTASANPSHTDHYAQIVLEFSKRRQMVKIAADLARAALEGGNDEWQNEATAVMLRADSALMGRDSEIVSIKKVTGDYADAFERDVEQGIDPCIATGITGLDKQLDGGVRREYIIIGALQGFGKSLLAMQIAGKLANAGRRGFVVGYDMSPLQVFMRDLAREASVPLNQIMGRVPIEGTGVFQDITRGISRMDAYWDVWYTTSPYVTLDTAIAHARSLHRQKPLDWIVVDYLQRVPQQKKGKERTDEALVAISDRLDKLQKELNCTLLAPVQLNDDGLVREARGLLDAPQVYIRIEMETAENQDGDIEAGDNGWFRILKNRFGVRDRRCPVFRNGQFQRFEDREYVKPATQTKNNKRTWNK